MSSSQYKDESGIYLERMVERKKVIVDRMLQKHQAYDDPLFMRMTYIASENKCVACVLSLHPLDAAGCYCCCCCCCCYCCC